MHKGKIPYFIEAAQTPRVHSSVVCLFVMDAAQQSATHCSLCSEKPPEETCEGRLVRDSAHRKPHLRLCRNSRTTRGTLDSMVFNTMLQKPDRARRRPHLASKEKSKLVLTPYARPGAEAPSLKVKKVGYMASD